MKLLTSSFLLLLNLRLTLAPELTESIVSTLSVRGEERNRSFRIYLLSKLSLTIGWFRDLLPEFIQEFRCIGGDPKAAGMELMRALSLAFIVSVSRFLSRLSEP